MIGMHISRRKFFQVSLLSGFSLYPNSQGKNERLLRKRLPFQPTITNYNETGRGIIIEGKTLLIAIALDADAEMVEGSLPVELLPSGNERLIEPQPLFLAAWAIGLQFGSSSQRFSRH